jgi:hypothetical protein
VVNDTGQASAAVKTTTAPGLLAKTVKTTASKIDLGLQGIAPQSHKATERAIGIIVKALLIETDHTSSRSTAEITHRIPRIESALS